jgi:hypothetical protein
MQTTLKVTSGIELPTSCPVCGSASGAHLIRCTYKHIDARLTLRAALPPLPALPDGREWKVIDYPMESR